MCEVIEIEGKNEQEINENITKQLNLSKNDVVIIDSVEKSSLFKGKKIISKVIKKEDIKNYIKSFFSTLAKSFNISINSEIKNEENEFNILLISDNNAILIGKAGKNLNAIQVILRTIIKRMTNNKVKINIDASNYKAKKIENLENEIKKIIGEILETKVDVKLDPMNSYERMIVHNYVNDYENLKTESIGEEPNRYIVIKYRED